MDADWVDARAACAFLEVKPQTLYAYASRGKVRSRPAATGRGRRYARADLVALRTRRDARRGHGAVAAGALRWGEPVLDTSVGEVVAGDPRIRGRSSLELAEAPGGFEAVAEWLWGARVVPEARPRWPSSRLPHLPSPTPAAPLDRLAAMLAAAAPKERSVDVGTDEAFLLAARRLSRWSIQALAPRPDRARAAAKAPSIARGLLHALGVRRSDPRALAVDRALVLVAEHGLNPSTFACRVAASTGASLPDCLLAAVATLSGPRHGGMPARIDALLDELHHPEEAADLIAERLRRGEEVVGFGHPLHPDGDPRFPPLLASAKALAPHAPGVRKVAAITSAMRLVGGHRPSLDMGLVALAHALGRDHHTATALFAAGRMAGWLAHVQEQRRADFVLRPRARYIAEDEAPPR